jgi:hypothetical protein
VRRDGVATGSNSYCPVTTVMDDPDAAEIYPRKREEIVNCSA